MSVGKLTPLSEYFLIFEEPRKVKRQRLAFTDTSEGAWTFNKTKESLANQWGSTEQSMYLAFGHLVSRRCVSMSYHSIFFQIVPTPFITVWNCTV